MFLYISSLVVAVYYIILSAVTLIYSSQFNEKLLNLNTNEQVFTMILAAIFMLFAVASIAVFVGCLLKRKWCVNIWLITIVSCLIFEIFLLASGYLQGERGVTTDFVWVVILNAICARSVIRRNTYREIFAVPEVINEKT